jgi:hypothetical protein
MVRTIKATTIKQVRADYKANKITKERRDELIEKKRDELAHAKAVKANKAPTYAQIKKMDISDEEKENLRDEREAFLEKRRAERHGPTRMAYTQEMKDEFKMPSEARTYIIKFKWHTPEHTDDRGRKVKAAKFSGRGWSNPIDVKTLKELYKAVKVGTINEENFRQLVSKNFPQLTNFNGAQFRSSSEEEDALIEITSLERMDEKPKDFNVIRQRIKAGGIIQPTLGSYGGKYVNYGEICKDEFYREDSCMMALFLETWKHRLIKKKYQSDLNHERLYEIATGEQLTDELGGVSLLEASKWCDHFQIQMTVIDKFGKMIYTYSAETLDKKIKSGKTWRIMITNGHVWQVSDEYAKEIDAKKSYFCENQQKAINDRLECQLPTKDNRNKSEFAISELYSKPMEPSTDAIGMASVADDIIFDSNNQNTNFLSYSTHDVEKLSISLYKAKYHPGNIFMSNVGCIERFTVIMERNIEGVDKYVEVKVNKASIYKDCKSQDENLKQHNLFQKHLYELRKSVLPVKAMSNYSSSLLWCFNEYGRGPINGYCEGGSEGEKQYIEFDITRAYTAFMCDIDAIPVFSKLDIIVKPCFEDKRDTRFPKETIDKYSFYLIKVAKYNLDYILFNSTYDFVSGETLLYADELDISYEIVGVCKPHTVIETDFKTAIKKMYHDSNLQDGNKKNICNIVYGLANKKYNKKIKGELYTNKRQAECEYSPRVRDFDDAFISVKIGRATCSQGYLAVGRIILDKSRIALHKINAALNKDGNIVKAIRTDAFFVSPQDKDKATTLLEEAGYFKGCRKGKEPMYFKHIGTLKYGTDATKKFTQPLKLNETQCVHVGAVPTQKVIKINEALTMEVDNVGRWNEVDQMMQSKRPIHLEATTPGCGKTFMIEEWIKRTGQIETSLMVCPWNALCSDLRKRGFNAITLHELCGKIGNGDDVEVKKNAYDLTGITHVHFDEICLHEPSKYNWIAKWIKTNEALNITRSATGDAMQLGAIGCDFHGARATWYKQAIAQVFGDVITLEIPKRVADPIHRSLMSQMCKELAEEKKPIKAILKDAGLKFMKFEDLTAADMDYAHITTLQTTGCKVDSKALSLKKVKTTNYEVGEELIGFCSWMCKGKKRISSSDSYIVDVINKKDSKMVLTASDGSKRELDLKKVPSVLRRPFSRTGHGTQGMSLGKRIYIHDIGHPMATYCWTRTAISRCSTLDIVIVVGSAMEKFNYGVVKNRIAGHVAADKAKGFEWDENKYVSIKWMKDKLLKQRWQCWQCYKAIDDDYSVDRTCNDQPHTMGNCNMVCRTCQHKSTHRP